MRTPSCTPALAACLSLVLLSACSSSTSKATASTTTAVATTTAAPASTTPTTATTVPAAASTTTLAAAATPTLTVARWTGRRPLAVYFSGDAGDIVDRLVWSSWGATQAIGHGRWHYLNCVPNCAQGTATPYAATLTVSDPVHGSFTKIVEVTSGPHGSTQTFTAPDLGQGACTDATQHPCGWGS